MKLLKRIGVLAGAAMLSIGLLFSGGTLMSQAENTGAVTVEPYTLEVYKGGVKANLPHNNVVTSTYIFNYTKGDTGALTLKILKNDTGLTGQTLHYDWRIVFPNSYGGEKQFRDIKDSGMEYTLFQTGEKIRPCFVYAYVYDNSDELVFETHLNILRDPAPTKQNSATTWSISYDGKDKGIGSIEPYDSQNGTYYGGNGDTLKVPIGYKGNVTITATNLPEAIDYDSIQWTVDDGLSIWSERVTPEPVINRENRSMTLTYYYDGSAPNTSLTAAFDYGDSFCDEHWVNILQDGGQYAESVTPKATYKYKGNTYQYDEAHNDLAADGGILWVHIPKGYTGDVTLSLDGLPQGLTSIDWEQTSRHLMSALDIDSPVTSGTTSSVTIHLSDFSVYRYYRMEDGYGDGYIINTIYYYNDETLHWDNYLFILCGVEPDDDHIVNNTASGGSTSGSTSSGISAETSTAVKTETGNQTAAVTTSENASAETKAAADAITSAAAAAAESGKSADIISGTGWNNTVNSTADQVKALPEVKKFESAHAGTTITATVKPRIEIQVKEATAGRISYEITPKYDIVLTAGADTKTIRTDQKLDVHTPVQVRIPAPANLKADWGVVYITHKLSNGTTKYYRGALFGNTITFMNPDGFSEFIVTTEKPEDFVDSSVQTIYRLYKPTTGEHLYTLDANEVRVITTTQGWVDETKGSAPMTALPGTAETGVPVYRFYCPALGHHFYTTDVVERNVLKNNKDWNYEGIAFKAAPKGTGTAVYRLNKNGVAIHHYTNQQLEVSVLTQNNEWLDEGIAWYSFN